jgi:surface antigen
MIGCHCGAPSGTGILKPDADGAIMSRYAVAGLLLLSGCSAFGVSASDEQASFAAHRPHHTSGFVPDRISTALGEESRGALAAAEREALSAPPGGNAYPWAADGVSGRVVAGPLYMVNARTCRSLVHVAERDGERLKGSTTLCQSRTGDWEPVG